jgi:oligopeptide/dipeptide ABC transporter ATP-binding protein
MTIGTQIAEPLRGLLGLKRRAAAARAVELLSLVGIPYPAQRLKDYPHQLSGGLRQRVLIAMALAAEPRLLIADEPTTALDVTVQAQIMTLLRDLRDRLGLAVLLITHDLGLVAALADRVTVLYAGRVAETASAETLFDTPRHPYTAGLLRATPRMHDEADVLWSIDGVPPDMRNPPSGCAFAPRCERVDAACALQPRGGSVACHHPLVPQ